MMDRETPPASDHMRLSLRYPREDSFSMSAILVVENGDRRIEFYNVDALVDLCEVNNVCPTSETLHLLVHDLEYGEMIGTDDSVVPCRMLFGPRLV